MEKEKKIILRALPEIKPRLHNPRIALEDDTKKAVA